MREEAQTTVIAADPVVIESQLPPNQFQAYPRVGMMFRNSRTCTGLKSPYAKPKKRTVRSEQEQRTLANIKAGLRNHTRLAG